MAKEKYWKMPDHFDSNTADIAVVGAGVIGVACALQLARQGQRVVVIDMQEPGHGASFTIRLPVSLAIIDCLEIRAAQESYFLHLDYVEECLELPDGQRFFSIARTVRFASLFAQKRFPLFAAMF